MKKMRIFLPIMVAVIGMFFFVQCKKDHSCNLKVSCFYSSNGLDPDTLVPFASISFDTVKYNAGMAVRPDIASVQNVLTDARGVFTYTLEYPALLIVNAVKIDTVYDEFDSSIVTITKYTGTTQIQVNEGETTEKSIMMVETN